MTIGSFFKRVLLTVGGLVFAFYLLFFILLSLNSGPGTVDENDYEYSLVDNRLASLQIDNNRIDLLDSYTLSGSWAGDNEVGLSVRVTGLDEELVARQGGVVRGDALTTELDSAVEFVTDLYGGGQLDWFPSYEQILSADYYVYPYSLDFIGKYPDSVRLLI
ncbi:MAG: hypothetical protein QGG54_12910, partial [Gammaproteobacteria bacterium]|nr:hypothetical protein [Gammaproteobacteria bacterium]